MVSKRFSSLFVTFGLAAPVVGATASTACSSKFEGCEASRTCGSGGEGGDDSGGKGGRGGTSAGRGGSAGKGGTTAGGGQGGGDGEDGGNAGAAEQGGSSSAGKGGQGSGGTGGTEDSMGGEGGVEAEPEPDDTPPSVVSVSPEDGEAGVAADAVIRVTFSEPMDQVATQLAYVSQDIPYAGTTRTWSDDGTVLTLTPNTPLEYTYSETIDEMDAAVALAAVGAVPVKTYSLGFALGAKDLAGNPLPSFEWSFTTLRRIRQYIRTRAGDTRRFYGNRNEPCVDMMYIGDSDSNRTLFGMLQFDLGGVPDNVVLWEKARFHLGERIRREGEPTTLGGVHIYEFEAPIDIVDLYTELGADVAELTITGKSTVEILDAMSSDYAKDDLVQLLVRTVLPSNNQNPGINDRWSFKCEGFISVAYYVP